MQLAILARARQVIKLVCIMMSVLNFSLYIK
uniref:Uncharacterized protein n=1 Tax=Arundo donax TaxID=35708 RepID=A0A0A9CK63_ARUDO